MSDFQNDFARLLSGTPQDASVAKTWSALLPLVCRYAGESWRKGGLWLFDNHGDHTHLTLWHWWSADGASLDAAQHVTSSIRHGASRSEDADLLRHLEPTRRELERRGLLPPDVPMAVAPIVSQHGGADKGPETIGFLALFSDASSATLAPDFQQELDVACGLVGAWMYLNREWRKAAALADFQKGQNAKHDVATLANCAVEQLRKFASARVAAAVYVPNGGDLVRIDGNGAAGSPVAKATSFVHRYHFGQVTGFRKERNFDEVQIEFDAQGRVIAPESLSSLTFADFPEVASRGRPISVLVARMKDARNGVDASERPTVATLLMATSPDPGFLGGRFSDTNRAVMRLIIDAFRNAYSLALQRDRLMRIAGALERIATARTGIDINDEASDRLDLCKFAELTRDCLPSVADAVICNINSEKILQNCWRADGASDSAPSWQQEVRPLEPVALGGQPSRWVWSRSVEPTVEGGTLSLDLLLTTHALSAMEESLLDRIIAELRIEYGRHIDKDDWARQLAEVRHNMRAVLGSVIGKADLLGERYEAAIQSRDPAEVFRRLVGESPFRKNIRALVHAGKELEALFENIRVLVGRLDADALQITDFDISDLVRSTIAILGLEAERRALEFRVIDRIQPSLRRVVADPNWTRIALFNLLENAIKYSDRGGRIDVTLEISGGLWVLKIENVGRYIPPDMHSKIFEPYQRVQHAAGQQAMPGTGLGLMTVLRFVEVHHPRGIPTKVIVESEPLERSSTGQILRAKTAFTISLPRRGPGRHG